ncbi:MAG: radical SAM protein [Kiritimatiellae bacterium]|nr:radical SAM protein [Kiritimatiellia bacterium]
MKRRHFITGAGKVWVYLRIILSIPLHYAIRPRFFRSPAAYVRFLARALRLLLVFRHNKVVRVFNGLKLHLYLPAYPSPAFYHALESKLLRTPPGPTTVVFSMTKACDYKCRHCYQRRDSGADVDEDLLIRTAVAVRDAGVAMFDIEGGEPFLRYPRLLRLVRALDDRAEIWINSTGAHIAPGQLEELKAAGVFGIMVSLHSPDAATHNAFTGIPGSFDTACRMIRQWRAMGRVAALNSVLSEDELARGGLDHLMNAAKDLDCDYVQLIHPKPAGQWLGRREDMQTDAAVIARVRGEHVRYNSRRCPAHPSLAAQVFEEAEHVLGCTAGAVDRFYVNAHGEVQPCEFLNISFGNVNDEPFETILARMRSFFPQPGTDWLCCTQAAEIHRLFEQHRLERTPLPWAVTQELVTRWHRGKPTPIYDKLGIYRQES